MDKIAEIINQLDFDGNYSDDDYIDVAKQIRQQIGRELFERHHQGWVHSDDIKEVCKLPPFDKNVETVDGALGDDNET